MTSEGVDALAERLAIKLAAVPAPQINTITFGELFAEYVERHVKTRCKESEASNCYYWEKAHGNRWCGYQVHTIRRRDVQAWVDELAGASPSAAARGVNVMQAVINWGIRRELLPQIPNPCQFVDRPKLESRERFLGPEELKQFADALEDEKPIYRDLFWLGLLTSARKGNLLAMEWAEIDFDLRMWTIPARKHKNGSTQRIPLVSMAVDILERRKQNCPASRWVFPGVGTDNHLQEPKRAWKRVLERAGLSDLRIHDLRRTAGSYLAINGEGQYVIGGMLGHKDGRATAVYARTNLQPVRTAAESLSETYQRICAIKTVAKESPKQIATSTHDHVGTSAIEARIVAIVRDAGRCARSDLLRAFNSQRVNAQKLDVLLQGLLDQNQLRRERSNTGAWLYLAGDAPAPISLSARQREVLQCLAKGLSNPQIAERLGLSLNTIKPCVRVILSKLGADNRQEATRIAMERRLISVD